MEEPTKTEQEVPKGTDAVSGQPAEPKKMTKEQIRQQERMQEFMAKVNAEAERVLRQLNERFLVYFIESDNPLGDDVKQKAKQLSVQWKIYCSSKKLRPEIMDMVEKYCNKLIEDYKQGIA